MKYLALLITLCNYNFNFAQCGSTNNSSSNSNSNEYEESVSSTSDWDNSSTSDYSSGDTKSFEDYPNFIIGGGIHFGLFSNSIGKSKQQDDRFTKIPEPTELWNQNALTGYLEVMIPFSTERLITFGVGVYWNHQKTNALDHYSLPTQESIQSAEKYDEVYRLDWNTRSTFNSFTYLAQTDVEIFNIDEIFYVLGRAEFGATNYQISTKVNYRDNCNCDHSILMDHSSKTSLTGGLGLGLSIGFEAFEFRSTIGYRIYNQTGLRSKNELSATGSVIDEANYDYLGYPERELFSLDRPSNYEPISQRNGVFYIQVGINIRFGDRW